MIIGKSLNDNKYICKKQPLGNYVKEASLGTSFIWNAGILDVSVEGGPSSQDTSIGELFVYVEDLSTYTYSHTHAQDSSIEDLYNYTLDLSTRLDNFDPSQDASIVDLYSIKADKTEIYSKSYIDGSLNAKQPLGNYIKEASLGTSFIWNAGILDVSVEGGSSSQDASIGELFVYVEDLSTYTYSHTHSQDASIDDLYSVKADKSYVDGSLNTKVNQALFDTSVASLTGWNLSQDASIGLINTDISSIESSIGDTTDITGLFLRETSLGTDFYFESGLLEVSIGIGDYATLTYVDGSLSTLNSWNVSQDASLALKANLNTSIVEVSTAYTVLSSDNNKVIEADASLVITLPDSLSTGFQITIVNASTGYVSIDASTVLSKGGYKILKDQYSGASAVHKGSGIWYLWGGLE